MAAVNRRRTPTRSTGARILRVLIVLILLGGTFGSGLFAGRYFERRASARLIHDPDAAGDTFSSRTRGRPAAPAQDPTLPRIQEKLTFYQTLTAPLGADAARERAAAVKPAPKPAAPPAPRPATPASEPRVDASTAFTIQVAAYKTRAQAEALRAKLGADAYVAESVTDSGTAFRVRVGSFSSRAEAEAIRVERALSGFITPR
jgi:cell division septation protein DedD